MSSPGLQACNNHYSLLRTRSHPKAETFHGICIGSDKCIDRIDDRSISSVSLTNFPVNIEDWIARGWVMPLDGLALNCMSGSDILW